MTVRTEEPAAALELVGVRRTFAIDDPQRPDAELDALAGITLRIEPGELVAITGPSGSGKSTLLHVAGGLDRPTEGEVLVDGINLAELSPTELARVRNETIGFVFQSFNLLPGLTVAENVALPAHLGRGRVDDLDARVTDLLSTVGLSLKAHHRPSQLAGGEQQRVAVARALVLAPPIILADEPTGNLDSRAGAAVMDLLLEAHRSECTVVLVTHDARLAAQCERVVHLRDGRVAGHTRPGMGPARTVQELLDTGG